MVLRTLSAALVCLLPLAAAADAKKYAVLVGVNEYQHPRLEPLKYAENDVKELGEVLAANGYAVTTLTGAAGRGNPALRPTWKNIDAQLKAALDKCERGDTVVVGLAGHGLQFEGDADAYFCPLDAKPFKEQADTLLSLGKVYRRLDESFAGMKVLFVDACRNDPNAGRGARSGVSADAAPKPPNGVAALFSCKAGERAFEHDAYKHGIFFHHVIQGLREEAADRRGDVTFAALAGYVSRRVAEDVPVLVGGGAKQSPNLKADYATEPVLSRVGDPVAADVAAYRTAYRAKRAEEYLRATAPGRAAAWKAAAEGGSVSGMLLYGRCLLDGIGAGKAPAEAARWFRAAADRGNMPATQVLGAMYATGTGVPLDGREAVRLTEKAAAAGEPNAMYNLGRVYEEGAGNLPRDLRLAVEWYTKAADLGQSQALLNLGRMYVLGKGVPEDAARAVGLYERAANAGEPGAMFNLAGCYLAGRGVRGDWRAAVEWLEKADAAGDANAPGVLGQAYATGGPGLDVDYRAAARWFGKGAAAGTPEAMHGLALLCLRGQGVDRDERSAAGWFYAAARKGNADSMVALAGCYAQGLGVQQSPEEAIKWFREAARLGHPKARQALQELGLQ